MCLYMSGILITIILIARLSASPHKKIMLKCIQVSANGGVAPPRLTSKYGMSGHSDLFGFF